MTAFLGLLALLLLLSALFSCSETSLFSLSRSDISYLETHVSPAARRIKRLIGTPRRTLITILIGNMFVNVLSSAACEGYIHRLFPAYSVLVSAAIVTPLILVWGEIVPKTIGFQLRRKAAPILSLPVAVLFYLFYPLQWIVFKFTDPFLSLFTSFLPSSWTAKEPEKYSDEEIRAAVDIGSAQGLFDAYEKELITKFISFRRVTAKYVLTPRVKIFSVDVNMPLPELRKVVETSPYSRIPVYDHSEDDIIGVILQKDLFSHPHMFDDRAAFIRRLHRPYFVPESLGIYELFRLMVKRRVHIHFVVDEYGGLEGLVTLTDVVSELFGEIEDKAHRRYFFWPKKGRRNTFIVWAGTPISEYNRYLHPRIEDDDSVTLGGFLSARLGKVPRPGDSCTYAGHVFTVISASDTRSILVEVSPLPRKRKTTGDRS